MDKMITANGNASPSPVICQTDRSGFAVLTPDAIADALP